MRIKINGITWKIKLISGSEKIMRPSKDSVYLGLTRYVKPVIYIRNDLPKVVRRQTLIHELAHAFEFSYGHKIDDEESMCNFIGCHADEMLSLTDVIMRRWHNADHR